MDNLAPFLARFDFTVATYILTWLSVGIALYWIKYLDRDPANACASCWCIWLRKLGIVLVELALMGAILFGEGLHWTPWPPIPVLLLGLNLYYLASIIAVRERIDAYYGGRRVFG